MYLQQSNLFLYEQLSCEHQHFSLLLLLFVLRWLYPLHCRFGHVDTSIVLLWFAEDSNVADQAWKKESKLMMLFHLLATCPKSPSYCL